jgi:hypothetical protein
MSKIKLLSFAVAGLLLLNLGTLAFLFFNKPSKPAGPTGEEGPKRIIIERLGFDKEQIVAYENLIKNHQQAIRKLRMEIGKTKNNLYSTLTGETQMNKDSLETRLGEIQKQVEEVHYNHFSDIKKICRPQQMDAFNSLTKDLAKYFAPGKKIPGPARD